MYQESGFRMDNERNNKSHEFSNNKKTGEIAEEMVLGSQSEDGYEQVFLKKDFEAKLSNITDILWENESIKSILSQAYPHDTEEKHIKLLRKQIVITFVRSGYVKEQFEHDRDARVVQNKEHPHYFQNMVIAEVKKHFSLEDAVDQVFRIAHLNKKHDQKSYNENLTTPFTLGLYHRISKSLQTSFPEHEWTVHYVPATLKNSRNKTFLDVFYATDAFVFIVNDKGFASIELIDFTTNPNKIEKEKINNSKGVAIRPQGKHEKYIVFVDSKSIEDEATLRTAGQECATYMVKNVTQKMEANAKKEAPEEEPEEVQAIAL